MTRHVRRVEKSHWAKKEEKPSGQLTTKKQSRYTKKKKEPEDKYPE